jgi:hypothetical protein
MSEHFLGAFITNATLNTRVVVCASGCISHTWPFSQPHNLNSQSSLAVTHYILAAAHFTYPEGWNPESRLSAPGIEPGPPAYMSEHALEQPMT